MIVNGKFRKIAIKHYLENNYHGTLNQIIKFLLESGYDFDDLMEIKEKIENILNKLEKDNFLKYDRLNSDYTLKPGTSIENKKENKLKNYGLTLIANIQSNSDDKLDLSALNTHIYESINTLGQYLCIDLNISEGILIGSFETELLSVSIMIRKMTIMIRCAMNPILNKKEPIYDYILEQKNQFSSEKRIYIPLNYGAFLIYTTIMSYLQKSNNIFTLKINSITFEE